MTPPDSGEHRAWCSGGRIDRHGTRLGCDCKPDSGEREVLSADDIAVLHELDAGGEATALEWRASVLAAHPFLLAEVERGRKGVLLPLSLAQRLLAALEECGEVVGPGIIFPRHTALADELRAVIPTSDLRKGP